MKLSAGNPASDAGQRGVAFFCCILRSSVSSALNPHNEPAHLGECFVDTDLNSGFLRQRRKGLRPILWWWSKRHGEWMTVTPGECDMNRLDQPVGVQVEPPDHQHHVHQVLDP
jgi:hypothetical protein